LRKIFGHKEEHQAGMWRLLHNEKLHYLYTSPNFIGVIKSKRMKWGGGGGHAACTGRGEVCTGFWWGDLRERDHLEDVGVDGRIILKSILMN
jgi:hypothetical protein